MTRLSAPEPSSRSIFQQFTDKSDFKLENIEPQFQRRLTEAVLSGAQVLEQIVADNLTEAEAYKLEYEQMREYALAGKRELIDTANRLTRTFAHRAHRGLDRVGNPRASVGN